MEDQLVSVLVTSAITLMSLMAILPEPMHELLFVCEDNGVEELFCGCAPMTREGYPLRIEHIPKI